MKITIRQLKQLIKEEINKTLVLEYSAGDTMVGSGGGYTERDQTTEKIILDTTYKQNLVSAMAPDIQFGTNTGSAYNELKNRYGFRGSAYYIKDRNDLNGYKEWVFKAAVPFLQKFATYFGDYGPLAGYEKSLKIQFPTRKNVETALQSMINIGKSGEVYNDPNKQPMLDSAVQAAKTFSDKMPGLTQALGNPKSKLRISSPGDVTEERVKTPEFEQFTENFQKQMDSLIQELNSGLSKGSSAGSSASTDSGQASAQASSGGATSGATTSALTSKANWTKLANENPDEFAKAVNTAAGKTVLVTETYKHRAAAKARR